MPSGKQLSFKNGEVSPSQRFKSDEVSYSDSVAKLSNMFVRRDGGVSNRPGLQFLTTSVPQTNIPSPGAKPGIKAFSFWDAENAQWKLIQYANVGTDLSPQYAFFIGQMFQGDVLGLGSPAITQTDGHPITGPNPSDIRFTLLKDTVFITPDMTVTGASYTKINGAIVIKTNTMDALVGRKAPPAINGPANTYGYAGTDPKLAVSYLVTCLMEDGTERYVLNVKTTGTDIYFPHSALHPFVNFVLSTTGSNDAGVKSINFYRAAGAEGVNSFFKLVGRIKYTKGQGTAKFTDYGAEDFTITPPIDGFDILDPINRTKQLTGVQCAAYYQQRLVMGMRPGVSSAFKAGDNWISKIGAPDQITAPTIVNDAGAFQFSVPVTDGTPIIAYLAMERLIAFTERGVYVVRGGNQGEITPSQINPLLISEEGCSKTVEPMMAGRRGYFINNTHTKLMTIEFSIDGNLKVFEASLLSQHLLYSDVVQLCVLGGGEDTVYFLLRNGKLVRVTCADDGTHGFSTMETSGYIESIFRGKAYKHYIENAVDISASQRYYDVLMCYVIRNGIRSLERLVVRQDRFKEGEAYSDFHQFFGRRLVFAGDSGYVHYEENFDGSIYAQYYVNIEASASFLAGATVKIRMSSNLLDGKNPTHYRVHFFYDDADGIRQRISYIWNGANATVVTDVTSGMNLTQEYSGYFEQDVPTQLQNVKAQSISLSEKKKACSYFGVATDILINNSGDGTNGADLYDLWLAGTEDKTTENSFPVSVVCEGEVMSSPLNPNKPSVINIHGGPIVGPYLTYAEIPLGDFFCWGYVGLPYASEMETLDIETADNRTLTSARKLINKVGLGLMETRGGFFGVPGKELTDMEEIVFRTDGNITHQTDNKNGFEEVSFPTEWNGTGRVSVKNVDPVPMTILSIYPKGISGD